MTAGSITHTACPYCGVGCGLVVHPDHTIAGDPAHPANRGRLCSKGAALAQTLDDTGRLTTPLIGGRPADWDAALGLVAARFRQTIAEHGPDSVAFYVSGQCLTEDYYVANKLMKGFIGSANIDTNSRLCMASSVAGHIRAFGEDIVPGVYEDWEEADLVVLVGSNAAWCHPVLHQRLMAARAEHGTRVVVIDPRRSATAESADMHLPIASGSDVALFNGLLLSLAQAGRIDHGWVTRHATGLDAALAAARLAFPETADLTGSVAAACGIDPELLDAFFAAFAANERVLTVWSQGVNQAEDGTDRVNAIINCHLATGRIGRPGMGPFSITGQPNAMGGREVGGLANQLAAHMRFDDPADRERLRRFWNAPALAEREGLKAVDLFEAVAEGRVKAVWIVATNPAVSLPDADRVRAALDACPFVVVSDCWPTDTTTRADVVLPAAAWGEKDGTVTNSERRISRQRPFRAPPGDARPDWWQFATVGRLMGWQDAFAWDTPAAIFREHAALSGLCNEGRRLFDISALAGLGDADYDAMVPIRWPLPAHAVGEAGRLFAQGGFPTPDHRARLVPTPWKSAPWNPAQAHPTLGHPTLGHPRLGHPTSATPDRLILNTGRVRDQWHTMSRTGLSPALMAHTDEPSVVIHPTDAMARGIQSNDLLRLCSDQGEALLRADLRHTQRRGEVFAPMHWTDQFASMGPIGRVVGTARDPVSGQPALKATRVALTPIRTFFHGLLLRRAGGPLPDFGHWVRIPVAGGHLYRLRGLRPATDACSLVRVAMVLLGTTPRGDRLEAADPRRGVLRVAIVLDGILDACLFLAREPEALPSEAAIAPMIGQPVADHARTRLLAGRPLDPAAADGPRVCACFGVSRDAVRHAIVTHGLRDVGAIGAHLRAGTNCGSCIPELEEILRDVRVPAE